MKIDIAKFFILVAFSILTTVFADSEYEKLKAAANRVTASLTVSQHKKNRKGHEYEQSNFTIDNGIKRYQLQYKTFLGENAKLNPKLLNDWNSGYGMLKPNSFWYSNGFINVNVRSGSKVCYMFSNQGKVKILERNGDRATYDIRFKDEVGEIVLRTVVLPGVEPLLIAVYGKINSETDKETILTTVFTGYPGGFKLPFDRLVLGKDTEIKNSGKIKKATTLVDNSTDWLLLTDQKLIKTNKAGQLGLAFQQKVFKKIDIVHRSNYAVNIIFNSEGKQDLKQYFMIYNFGTVSSTKAEKQLSLESKNLKDVITRAFDNLPAPF